MMTNTAAVTEKQQREAEHFDSWVKPRAFKMDLYSQPEFGPWNPYWFSFDFVRRQYRGPHQRLLSFGCGRGANAIRFANMGYEVFGFDISSRTIDVAVQTAAEVGLAARAHFSVQAAEQLSYPDAFFDVIAGENVLHHTDIDRAIDQVARLLKPGGVAIFKEPWATPHRDRIRKMPPISWIFPVGMKNVSTKEWYHHPPETTKLDASHLAVLRRSFTHVEVYRFRVLAVLGAFTRTRTFFEKCDLALFRLLPFFRRFGDQVVVIARKDA